ncbi:MAG: pseudouridine synthase, partial [Myxococcota bacterium]
MESPSHHRFNPPVEKHVLRPSRMIRARDVRRWIADSLAWEDDRIDAVLWHGGVHLNGKRLSDSGRDLPVGSEIRVYAHRRVPETVELPTDAILFEDDHWVAVNKPPWLPVQGTRASRRISLETILRERTGCEWLSPVHRLDRQTSGVNLFARTPHAFEAAARQFRRHQVRKHYLAVADGLPQGHEWCVRGWL